MKTALVTGGAGFIGSHIVQFLVSDLGMKVYVLDNLSSGTLENIPRSILDDVVFLEGDITELDQIEENLGVNSLGFDLVVHCAAQTDVRESMEEPAEDAYVNIIGSIEVLEFAALHKAKKFIFLSTGGAMYSTKKEPPYVETSPLHPVCGYGISKRSFEQYLRLFAPMKGIDYSILRLSNVYGPRNKKGVISIFKRLMEANESVVVNGGEQTRDYVHVYDVVRAVGAVVSSKRAKNQTFNVGTGKETSLLELVALMQKEYPEWGGSIIKSAYKEGEVMRNSLDASKLANLTYWKPHYPTVNIRKS